MSDFITVDTPTGPVRFPKGMSREAMAAALNSRNQTNQAPKRSAKDVIIDNVIGVDDGVESYGEKLGSMIRGGTAAVARGIADIPALPANVAQLGVAGYEKITGAEEPSKASQFLSGLPDTREMLSSVPVIGPESEYKAPGKVDDWISTVGEFAGGAGIAGGAKAMMRYGAIPGVASEGAGQVTEGTAAEPYARAIAPIVASLLAGKPTSKARPVLPADADDVQMAETLIKSGVKPTVGQVTGNSILRRMEGSVDALPAQADDFTAAAMKTTGSTAARALPESLKAASDDIVQRMDDAVSGVTFSPSTQMAQQADDVVRDYTRATAKGNIVPDVRNVADEIIDAATGGGTLSLSTLKDWRSRLGRLMKSNDPQVKQGAYGLRKIIDDATEQQLAAAGRVSDVEKLATARRDYRNFLAVSDASTRAGAEGGRISPMALNQSVIRSQGRRNAAVGKTTELGEMSRAGAGLLRGEPTVSAGGARNFSPEVWSAILGGGMGAQLAPNNPIVGALLGAGLGSGGISTGQSIMRSAPVQSTLMDPRGKLLQSLMKTGPAVITGN